MRVTPSVGWVLAAPAPAAATTPGDAWRKLRAPLLAAIAAAEARVRAADDSSADDYNLACALHRAAIEAHKAFYRRNPQPQKSAQWRDYRHDDPLVNLIFGGKNA
jgi:hypothetical protein